MAFKTWPNTRLHSIELENKYPLPGRKLWLNWMNWKCTRIPYLTKRKWPDCLKDSNSARKPNQMRKAAKRKCKMSNFGGTTSIKTQCKPQIGNHPYRNSISKLEPNFKKKNSRWREREKKKEYCQTHSTRNGKKK